MHKAKGLEWDRVYLMSVNNYDFPSGQADDSYIAEKWFVRDQLNLEAEALAQLETACQQRRVRLVRRRARPPSRPAWITSASGCACSTWASPAPAGSW